MSAGECGGDRRLKHNSERCAHQLVVMGSLFGPSRTPSYPNFGQMISAACIDLLPPPFFFLNPLLCASVHDEKKPAPILEEDVACACGEFLQVIVYVSPCSHNSIWRDNGFNGRQKCVDRTGAPRHLL